MKKILLSVMITVSVLVLSSCGAKPGGAALPSGASVSGTAPATQTAGATETPGITAGSPDLAPPSGAGEEYAVPADAELILLEGTVGTSGVHMMLSIKDGAVSGSYYYSNPENDLKLSGTIEANRMLTMTETDAGGEVTGTFDGWYVPGIRLEGSWTNAKTGELLDFKLKVQGGVPEDAVWSGEWKRLSDIFNSATLSIYNESAAGFDFQLDAFNGSHMGFLSGTAAITGTTARYRDAGTGAELTFSLEGGNLTLTANAAANGQAGANVVFDGSYTNGELPETTLLSLGYVDTPGREQTMRELTGSDYDLFLYTAQLREETSDLDGLGASCAHWWVYGLAGSNESVVMLLPGGTVCAAVIDPGKNLIKVYTDEPSIKAVPKTVKVWADKYPELTVEFHGAAGS